MKRIALFLVALVTLVSCGDEIEFNTPALQANKEYDFWKAKYFSASINDSGYLTISGGNAAETVALTVPTVLEGTYVFGDVNSMEARFENAQGTVFSTNNRPASSVSIYPEYGEIVIESIDYVNASFTGTFHFLAFNEAGNNSIGFNEGVFYQIPLTSGSFPSAVYTCDDAIANTQNVLANLALVDMSDSDAYEVACNTYVAALENQKNYCGDVDGAIQDIIDGLNNCQLPCEQAEINRAAAQIEFENASIGNYTERCANYLFYLTEQMEFCGDEDGSIQIIIDALNCADDDNDGIPTIYEDFNGDGDITNDDIDADGIPNYLDNDDDGDGVLTADEQLDIDGNPIDSDGDGDVDFLDNDDDGDGILSMYETGNTDGDTLDDYLDADDDDDGILTSAENADPNGDGDPADAIDTDADGIPDYLDDM
ncbi:MAG: hypothetical protein BM564_04545 [Bacteroidetes bacterium MedPE-SWsnd-G2]|nr:MAG: hypothetical protein BM564_04545 [Bacteroidetes bacterium MedPE-SWsnd-G2]